MSKTNRPVLKKLIYNINVTFTECVRLVEYSKNFETLAVSNDCTQLQSIYDQLQSASNQSDSLGLKAYRLLSEEELNQLCNGVSDCIQTLCSKSAELKLDLDTQIQQCEKQPAKLQLQ